MHLPHLKTIADKWNELNVPGKTPRNGKNRVLVSDKYVHFVTKVISKKRHVKKRGHQEGKHQCKVKEILPHFMCHFM